VGEVNEALTELFATVEREAIPETQRLAGGNCSPHLPDPACLTGRCQPSPYCIGEWKTIRVNRDYHVAVNSHFYSVPYQLVGQQVEARSTSAVVELFLSGAACGQPHPRIGRMKKATQHQ